MAKESVAASEELSGQVQMLKNLIDRFHLKNSISNGFDSNKFQTKYEDKQQDYSDYKQSDINKY